MVLRIERVEDGESVVFVLSGRIEAEYVDELERLFSQDGRTITLDLKEVTLIDREVIDKIARWESEGIRLESCPAYVRDWIEKSRIQK
jgi:anti-anti-sigma regulatory factor